MCERESSRRTEEETAPGGACCDGATSDDTLPCSNETLLVEDAPRVSGKSPAGLDVSFAESTLRLLGGFGARLGRGIRTSAGPSRLLTEATRGVDLASLSLNSSRRVLTLDLGEAKAWPPCSSLIGGCTLRRRRHRKQSSKRRSASGLTLLLDFTNPQRSETRINDDQTEPPT